MALISAKNFINHGLVNLLPQLLSSTIEMPSPLNVLYKMLIWIFNPFICYLIISIFQTFIAFLGMFLLLFDIYLLNSRSCFLGALFFAAIPLYFGLVLSQSGIPLYLWSIFIIMNLDQPFKKKLIVFINIILYSLLSSPFHVLPSLLFFIVIHFLFLDNWKINFKNIFILFLILTVILILNLPTMAELYAHGEGSMRNVSKTENLSISAFQSFVSNILYNHMNDGQLIITPSLAGLFMIIYYLFSFKKIDKNRNFYLSIIGALLILIIDFLILKSSLWNIVESKLGILKSVSIRFHYVLIIFYAIIIAQSVNFYILQKEISIKFLLISFLIVLVYFFFSVREYGISGSTNSNIIQLICCIFLFLFLLIFYKKVNLTFVIILISFVLFLIINIYTYGDKMSYYSYFHSSQIERIKLIEKNDMNNFRVVLIGSPTSSTSPGVLMYNEFNIADGYVSIYPQAYKEYWEKVIEPDIKALSRDHKYLTSHFRYSYLWDSINKNEVINDLSFNLNLLKLLGVKYLFSPKKINNFQKYQLIEVENPSNYNLNRKLSVYDLRKYFVNKNYTKENLYYIYKTDVFAPLVFLTDSIELFNNNDELLDKLGERDFNDLIKTTMVANDVMIENKNLNSVYSNSNIVEKRMSPDKIEIKIKNPHPVILNVTRNFNKYWKCTIDNKPAEIFKIYNSFIGVYVPENSSNVVLKYFDKIYYINCLISIITFLLISITIYFIIYKRNK